MKSLVTNCFEKRFKGQEVYCLGATGPVEGARKPQHLCQSCKAKHLVRHRSWALAYYPHGTDLGQKHENPLDSCVETGLEWRRQLRDVSGTVALAMHRAGLHLHFPISIEIISGSNFFQSFTKDYP